MNRYCIGVMWAAALLGWAAACRADYINHRFDADPFTNGATFTAPVLQWQASTDSVVVTSTKASSPLQSVYVPGGAVLSNAVAVTNPGVVWTDIHVAPCLGDDPDPSVTNGVATLQYFGTNGYLNVWTNGGWLTCSNDVWGQPVIQVTTGVFADLAIYQNFTSRTAAILLNDQVVIQDLPLLGSATNYNAFLMGQAYGDAWLDDAYIQAAFDSARLTHDLNGIDGADASELQAYGYVARTLYVGTGSGSPRSPTIQAALNALRARDALHVYAGQYAEDVMVSNGVTFGGQAFTNSGSLTIGEGVTVAFQNATAWSNIVVGTNAQVTFNQPLLCSNLTVSANATVTFGGSATVGSATVLGSVLVTGASTVTVTTDLNVPSSGSGHLDFSGGRLTVPSSGVDMTGTFSITNTWGTQATATLDFSDTFELYAADSQMANLGFRGWGASSAGVLVEAGFGVSGSQAALVPEDAVLSNRITTSVGQTKIWTDYYLRPSLGEAPTGMDTNRYTSLSFVDMNGFLNVWNAGSWTVCSNYLDGNGPVPAMTNSTYSRLTVFLNFGSHLSAFFVSGKLVLQKVPFPAGAAIPSYTSFRAESPSGGTYLDNVRITTGIPSGLSRAEEIQLFDALMAGSVYKIR